jgi:Ca-activated chloride channel family protein
MNKTVALVSLAAGLALSALVLGLPHLGQPPHPATPVVTPTPPATATNGSLTMASRLSHPYITPGTTDLFVTVDITGVQVPGSKRTPVNLAVVIDRSGSMSGYKLQQAKQAARHLVGMLGPEDRLAIAHYGSDVKSLPSLPATPSNRERMLQYIEGIWDDGGTNIGAGLHAGRSHLVATRGDYTVNRIILLSDGQPTEGITDDAGLTDVVKSIRAEGITVSAIGVGTDFNEDLMQGFAEYGAGAYGFLEDAGQLATLFQKDLQQAATSVARNVELSFQLPEGVTLGEVLGYRASQAGRTVRVPLPDFSAGQVERVVARLTVVGTRPGSTVDVSGMKLAYSDLLKGAAVESAASLSALVTEQREEMLARQDKDATVYATRALSAKNLKLAAEALREGRREEARGYVMQNQVLFRQAGVVASPAAVEADMAEQKAVLQDYEQADSDEAVGAAVKRSKAKAMKSFGKLGSTY